MSDQQRPEQPPEGEARQQPPPEPPPWPTLGADWKEKMPPPSTQTPPRPDPGADQWWQEPSWAQPPVPAPWNHPAQGQHHPPPAPHYPGARIPDSEARNWALAAHLSPLLAVLIGLPFLGPMVVWLAKREDHPYIYEQGREALNFNLSMFIYLFGGGILSIVLSIVTLGLFAIVAVPAMVALSVAWLVLSIVAAVKAANGEPYRYPITMRMVN